MKIEKRALRFVAFPFLYNLKFTCIVAWDVTFMLAIQYFILLFCMSVSPSGFHALTILLMYNYIIHII